MKVQWGGFYGYELKRAAKQELHCYIHYAVP